MTYKNVLDDFFQIIANHKMIKTAGYGPLSEIKVPHGQYDTNYPYAFLQPTNHTLGKGQMTYRFNLIMMEMPKDDIDSVIEAQSNCLEYVKDILGHFYYHLSEYDFNLNVSVVPFKEKYDDVVSGITATIELTVRDVLNDCIAPFDTYNEVVWAKAAGDYIIDADPGGTKVYTFDNVLINDGSWSFNRYEVPYDGDYRVVMNAQIKLVEPLPGEQLPTQPVIHQLQDGTGPLYIPANLSSGWPTAFVSESEIYNVEMEWSLTDLVKNPGGYILEFVFHKDVEGVPESALYQLEGSEIKIYRLQ